MLIDEYLRTVNDIVAVFVDSLNGFQPLQNQLIKQADENGYDTSVIYKDPKSGSVAVSTTLGERVGRNA